MNHSRLRVRTRALALLLSVATLFGVVAVATAQPANALPTLESPNGRLLPDKLLQAPLDALMSTVDGVQETIAALQNAVTVIQTGVLGDGTPANPGLAADIQEYLAALAADPTNAPTTAPAFLTGALLPPALTIVLPQLLNVLQKVSAPVCDVVGAAASLQNVALPTIPDYSIFGDLGPIVKRYDQKGQDVLTNYYAFVLATLLAPITAPAALSAASPYLTIANLILSLFKTNWHSVYYPADNPTHPIVHDTKGVMFLPSLVDVDNNLTFDICANMSLDLLGGTGKVTQQIARIPTSDPNMQLDINGSISLLGVLTLGYGYDTKGSHVPAMFDTTTNTSNNPISSQLNVPGPTFAQYFNTGITLAGAPLVIQNRLETTRPPHTYNYKSVATKSGSTTIGTTYNWSSSDRVARSAQRTHTTGKLGALTLDLWSGLGTLNSDRWEYCSSTNTGFCSNAPSAMKNVETASQHFTSTGPPADFFTVSNGNVTTCPTDTHLHGNRFFYGAKIPTTSSTDGHAWSDTDGTPITGCQATNATYPIGFNSANRLATWVAAGPPTSKTGTINCPTGTLIKTGTVTTSNYLCTILPVNTVLPSITGNPYQQAVLTANKGTWTPATGPAAPTFTYQWKQCDAAGTPASCTNIAGATSTTYSPTAADLGHKLVVVVTATNFDGAVSATSAPTPVITLPPAPANTALPVISGILGSGHTLSTSDGTWANSPASFTYQWQLCALSGSPCSNIPGATANTYAVQHADENKLIQSVVTAHNLGGNIAATSVAKKLPPHPTNTVVPVIKNGSSPAAGETVFQGDVLKVNTGTWNDATSFTYQWTSCSSASVCGPIGGAFGPSYSVKATDIGSTIGVTVTAKNANTDGDTPIDALPTGTVVPNSLNLRPTHDVPDGTVNAAAPTSGDTNIIGGQFDTVGRLADHAGALAITPTAASKVVSKAAQVQGGTVNATASDTAAGYFLGGNFTSVLGQPCLGVAHIKADGTLDTTYCQAAGFTGSVKALDYQKRTYANSGASSTMPGCTTGTACTLDVLAVGGDFVQANGHKNLAFIDNTGFASYPTQGDPDAAVWSISTDAVSTRTNYFFGGEFLNVGSVPAKRVALANFAMPQVVGAANPISASNYFGGVDCAGGTCPTPAVVRSVVYSLTAAIFPNVVIGGTFDRAYDAANPSGVARNNAAAYAERGTTAPLGSWAPNPNGPVNVIATPLGSSSMYIGGDFTQVSTGTTVTSGLKGLVMYGMSDAPFSTSWLPVNGTPGTTTASSPNTAWKPQVDNGTVLTIAPVGGAEGIYVGGSFTSINATSRHRLANLSTPGTAAATLAAWDPNAGQTVRALSRYAGAAATTTPAAPAIPGAIFTGGDFRVLGGQTRNNVAELTKDGDLTTKDAGGTNGAVNAVTVKSGVAYVGGLFTSAGGAARSNLAAFDYSGAAAALVATFNPGTDGAVKALTNSVNGVLVGGSFATAGGAPRSNLAELDAAGAAIGSTVGTDGPVNAINVKGDNVYVGGAFASAGGSPRANLAGITYSTGALSSWNPGTNGPVNALASNNDGIFVGGSYSSLSGAAINNLGLVDAVGDEYGAWLPQPDGAVKALLLSTSKLFVAGSFANIGGAARARVAQLDATADGTGGATNFAPDADGAVNAITITSPGLVLGLFGAFNFINPGPQETIGVGYYGV